MSVKKLLYGVLQDALGDYIEGLAPESLKLGLWSGKIELRDLRVNTKAVDELSLPVRVESGTVGKLSVAIPWSSLGSTPVRIAIENVDVTLTAPADPDPIQLKKVVEDALSAKLERADAACRRALEAESEVMTDPGYMRRLAAKVVDNLEINISHVRARVAAADCACSMSCQKLSLQACDPTWTPAFVERGSATELLRNAVSLQGFSITFNNEDVLSPITCALKLTRNPGCVVSNRPQYDVELALDDVRASLESRALRGSTKLVDALTLAARRQKLLDQHPYYLLGSQARPVTSKNARCWWRYAARLACPALDAKKRASEALLGLACSAHDRRAYLEALCAEDTETVRRIERSAPFEALRMWRRDDVVATIKRERAEAARKAETQQWSSWFSWRKPSSKEDAFEDDGREDDDVTTDQIEELLERDDEGECKVGGEFLRVRLSTSLTCTVSHDKRDLASLHMSGSVSARATAGFASVDATADLAQFVLEDTTGMLKSSGIASGACVARRGAAPLRVVFTKRDDRTSISITGDSYDVAYHKLWLSRVVEALTSDATAKAARAAAEQARRYRSIVARAAEGVLQRQGKAATFAWDPSKRTLVISVDVGAPTILVPMQWDRDAGLLVIDTGSVTVDGGAAATGQRWDVALHGATARVGDRDVVLSPLRLDLRVDLLNDAPLDASITLSKCSLGMARDDIRDVLGVVAALGKSDSVEVASDDATAPPQQREGVVGLRLNVRAPLVELVILEPDRSRCMVLAITELKAALVSGGSSLTVDALLGGVRLSRSNVALIETRGNARAANAIQLARVAFDALPAPPSSRVDRTDGAVLAVRFRSVPEPVQEGFHSDIDVEFATLRLAVGAVDLKPLEPFMNAVRVGLAGFSAPVTRTQQHVQVASTKRLRVSLRLGELACTLRNDTGDVATAAIVGLGAAYTKSGDAQSTFVRLARVDVADTCAATRSNHFRSMVVPWARSDDARGASLDRLLSGSSEMQLPPSDLMLAVDYGDVKGRKTVSLTAKPITVQLFLEPIGAAIEAALSTIKQIVVLAVSTPSVDEIPVQVQEGSLEVRVEVRACEFLLVEDVASQTSRALSLRTGVLCSLDGKDDQSFAEQRLKVSVRDVEVALIDGAEKSILAPTSLTLHLEKRFASSELYDWRLNGDVSPLNLRLSYRDVLSVASIVKRAPSAGSTSVETEEAPLQKSNRVVTAALKFNVADVSVALVDDAKGPAAPLVDLSLTNLAASINGPSTELEGHVKTTLKARAFDLRSLRFEPLIETYAVTYHVKANAADKSWDVTTTSEDVLDAVLSTAFAARLIRLQGSLQTDLSARRRIQQREAFSLRNETGLVLDVRAGTREWTRVNEGAALDLRSPTDLECRLPGGRILPALPCRRPASVKLEHGLVWSCGFDEDEGLVVGKLSRRAAVTNKTLEAFDVAVAVEGYGDVEIVSVKPASLTQAGRGAGAATPLPPSLSGGALRLRHGARWGRPHIGGDVKKTSVNFEDACVIAHAKRDGGEPAIVLHAPVVVENRLPCGVLVRIQAKAREGRCRVDPGKRSSCCAIDVQEGCWLALRVGNLRGRLRKRLCPADLPNHARMTATESKGLYEVALSENAEDVLAVAIRAERRHRGLGLFLVVEAPLWVVDRTGLHLDLAAAPGGSLLPPGLARKASEVRRALMSSSTASKQSFGDGERVVETASSDLVKIISVASARRHYLANPAKRGDRLYADADAYVFVALPPPLTTCQRLITHDGHTAIGSQASQLFRHAARSVGENTASFLLGDEDRARFLHLEAGANGLDLYVATDSRINRPPSWVVDHFERCLEPIIAEKRRGPLDFGGIDQRKYDVWVRRLVKDEAIDLGPNEQKTHYLVFLAEGTASESTTPDTQVLGAWAASWPGYAWADPLITGRRLLAARDNSLSVGCRGAWSGRYSVGTSEFPILLDCRDGRRLDLEVRSHALGGAFGRGGGRSVEVVPRLALRNVDNDVQILVRRADDPNADNWMPLLPLMKQASAWHWPADGSLVDRRHVVGRVQFGVGGFWSAPVPLDRVAGHALFVDRADVVIRVEIRANDNVAKPPHEAVTVRCAVDRVDMNPLFLVRNQSSQYLQVRHADRRVASLSPSEAKVVGFVDVDADRKLEVISPQSKDQVDVGCVSGPLRLSKGALDARVALEDGARVLIVSDGGEAFEEKDLNEETGARRALTLKLKDTRLHIVDGSGKNRSEVLSVTVRGMRYAQATEGSNRETELTVTTLQIDQFAQETRWPVLLNSKQTPVFEAAAASEGATLRYLAAKLLPLEVGTDTTSLRALGRVWTTLSDARTEALDRRVSTDPGRWAEALLFTSEYPESCDEARKATFEPRGVVDALVLHPVQLEASFSPVYNDDDEGDTAVERMGFGALANLAEIDRAEVQLKSFAVEKAVEEPELLAKTIRRHYVLSLLQQLHRVVGSLASIGQPLNLVSTIGGGAKQFFYEPSKGIVESPTAFAKGVHRGTSALASSVVGGFATSIGGVGNVLANNASLLAGDASYSQQRDARRRASKGRNMASSAAGGAESVVRGVGEGVAGVFLQPVRGAQKGGVGGFFKGVARGVAGVVVKPVVGVLDGATQVVEGFGTAAGGGAAPRASRVAPPLRFVQLSDSEECALRGTEPLGDES